MRFGFSLFISVSMSVFTSGLSLGDGGRKGQLLSELRTVYQSNLEHAYDQLKGQEFETIRKRYLAIAKASCENTPLVLKQHFNFLASSRVNTDVAKRIQYIKERVSREFIHRREIPVRPQDVEILAPKLNHWPLEEEVLFNQDEESRIFDEIRIRVKGQEYVDDDVMGEPVNEGRVRFYKQATASVSLGVDEEGTRIVMEKTRTTCTYSYGGYLPANEFTGVSTSDSDDKISFYIKQGAFDRNSRRMFKRVEIIFDFGEAMRVKNVHILSHGDFNEGLY